MSDRATIQIPLQSGEERTITIAEIASVSIGPLEMVRITLNSGELILTKLSLENMFALVDRRKRA